MDEVLNKLETVKEIDEHEFESGLPCSGDKGNRDIDWNEIDKSLFTNEDELNALNQINKLVKSINEIESSTEKISEMHNIIANELQQISAKSVADLSPLKNHDFAFKISFIDPNQKSIKCE
ncbi:hypothetical protein BpHYR1_043917, partial [Brachionus plicatilis]